MRICMSSSPVMAVNSASVCRSGLSVVRSLRAMWYRVVSTRGGKKSLSSFLSLTRLKTVHQMGLSRYTSMALWMSAQISPLDS